MICIPTVISERYLWMWIVQQGLPRADHTGEPAGCHEGSLHQSVKLCSEPALHWVVNISVPQGGHHSSLLVSGRHPVQLGLTMPAATQLSPLLSPVLEPRKMNGIINCIINALNTWEYRNTYWKYFYTFMKSEITMCSVKMKLYRPSSECRTKSII